MAYKVIVTKPAEQDIEQAFYFIKEHSSPAANAWLDAIQHAIESLREMPNRAAVISENTGISFEYRNLIHRSHRIVFRVDEISQTVFVVRVYHSARAPLDPGNVE